jgi:hypothetical protein
VRYLTKLGWAGGAGSARAGWLACGEGKGRGEEGQLGLGLRWPVGWWPMRGV